METQEEQQPKKKLSLFWKSVIFAGIIWLLIKMGGGDLTVDSVKNSKFDGSVAVVEEYIKEQYLRDPSSYESVEWGDVVKREDGTYSVRHTFRARNGFGGMGVESKVFTISKDGKQVTAVY